MRIQPSAAEPVEPPISIPYCELGTDQHLTMHPLEDVESVQVLGSALRVAKRVALSAASAPVGAQAEVGRARRIRALEPPDWLSCKQTHGRIWNKASSITWDLSRPAPEITGVLITMSRPKGASEYLNQCSRLSFSVEPV